MRRLWKLLLAVGGALFLGAVVFLIPTLWFTPWSIDHFYSRVFLEYALDHPMLLSQMRILEPMGLDFHNDDLDDPSVAFQLREAERVDRNLEILRSYDVSGMTSSERLSRDVLEWFLADAQAGNRFQFHGYPLNQTGGVHNGLPSFMITTHRIDDPAGAEDYVIRVEKFGPFFDAVLDDLRHREEMGIIPPRFVITAVLRDMEAFRAHPAEENQLFVHFQEALVSLEGVEESRKQELLDRLRGAIEGIVYPAYGRLIDYYTDLEAIATTDDGVWKLPDGDEFYAYRLRSSTTTDLTAEEIHQLGLRQLEWIHAEMREILASLGRPTDDLAASMRRLNAESLYPDTDGGRAAILRDYQAIIDEIDAGLDPLFDVRPAVGVTVEPVPDFMEEKAPGAYYQAPPMDGSRPGTFFVNLRSVAEIPEFGMRTLAYHEAIPGHHFQIAVAQGLTGLPFFRRIIPFTAYTEGWALYAETVAAEAGFEDDPLDRLGYLTSLAFRATRLVVDTGIHAKRWTRQQAIDFMLASTGMPEGDVVAEVERYIVWPGQACAYMVGYVKILELRDRAREALGADFDIREFHDVVLTHGALPLTLLERVVDDWIAERGA